MPAFWKTDLRFWMNPYKVDLKSNILFIFSRMIPEYFFSQPPSVGEISDLLNRYEQISLKLPAGSYDNTLIREFHDAFPDHVVFDQSWLGHIRISPAIRTSLVMKSIYGFLSCIKAFDEKAHELMGHMAEKFGIAISAPLNLKEIKLINNLQSFGKLNDEWEYGFQLNVCMFRNIRTGQFLSVYIDAAPEFGVIEPFYLLQFINSTASLSTWKTLLEDRVENVQKVINLLRYEDFLTDIGSPYTGKLILNRTGTIPG